MGDEVTSRHVKRGYIEFPKGKQADFFKSWGFSSDQGMSQKIIDCLTPFLAVYMGPQRVVIIDKISINAYSSKLDRKRASLEANDKYYYASKN